MSYATYVVMLFWPSELGMFYIHPKRIVVWKLVGGAILLAALSVLVLRFEAPDELRMKEIREIVEGAIKTAAKKIQHAPIKI